METKERTKSPKKIILIVTAVVLAIALAVSIFLIVNSKNKVIAKCNGVEIRESTYRMYLYAAMQDFMTTFDVDVYTKNFWDVEIEGKLPEAHIKENALNRLKLYAYYKSGCEKNNIALSEEAYQNFISYYDEQYGDYDTLVAFGVERQFFLEYLYETYLFDMYFAQEAVKVEVSEEEIQALFDKNREDSARVTVKTIFLKVENENWDALKTEAYALKEQIQNGASMDSLIAEESDYQGNNAGEFVVVSSSSYSNSLGKEFISSVLKGNEGDLTVLKTSTGYCVNQIMQVELKESARKDLVAMVQEEKYAAQVATLLEKSDDYTVTITKQRIYDSISLPGFDVEEEESETR